MPKKKTQKVKFHKGDQRPNNLQPPLSYIKKMKKKKKDIVWQVIEKPTDSVIAEYFFELYSRKEFRVKYENVLKRYLEDKNDFLNKISTIQGIKVIPSCANFFLVEILSSKKSDDIVEKMLFNHGVYVRTCSDKIGLEGEYLRIASRSKTENDQIFDALKKSI